MSLDSSLLLLATLAWAAALIALRRAWKKDWRQWSRSSEFAELVCAIGAALVLPALALGRPIDLVPVLALVLGIIASLCLVAHRLSMSGILWTTAQLGTLVILSASGARVLMETGVPYWAQTAGLIALVVGVILFALAMLAGFAREAVLTHELWQRPTSAPVAMRSSKAVKVSLHLPCYAEPPEVVMSTMDSLAALDYPDFEVLVCDNNTRDERLWRPLEAHCGLLNRRLEKEVFRFFHVAPLAGAKAGALNFCLEQMAPQTEIIGVVDADYQSRPDFLRRLVPFFANPALGYVQTPHDYRDYQTNDFLTACYWEYMPANKIDWSGVSEYGGAFTIGTMCLFRAEGLRRAGGWAEWCLTEDSEVSVRIRASGFEGLYLSETFGRGLIPCAFDDYRKQRFRWTAGPVQQLRRHWRLLLPAPLAPRLPGWTKLLEIVRCAAPLLNLATIAAAMIGGVATVVMVAAGVLPQVDVPNVVWLLLLLGALTSGARTLHRYLLSGCASPSDMLRGEIARASLDYVTLAAGLAGLSKRPLTWRRTPKFSIRSTGKANFAGVIGEINAALACLALATAALLGAPLWGWELGLFVALGPAIMGLRFACAPFMVVLEERHSARVAETRVTPAAIP